MSDKTPERCSGESQGDPSYTEAEPGRKTKQVNDVSGIYTMSHINKMTEILLPLIPTTTLPLEITI